MTRKNLAEERIGITNENSYGSEMVVYKYNSATDIWVKFLEHGNLVHTRWRHFCDGNVKNVYDKTICDVGYIGEGEYHVMKDEKLTHQYRLWTSMLARCYSEKRHKVNPSYIGCTVHKDWHNFQSFARWVDENFYTLENHEMHLDKDILTKGNKIYSPDTCVFVPSNINGLILKCDSSRNNLPIGVCYDKREEKFAAFYRNNNGKKVSIGLYNTPKDAFQVYKTFKESLIKQIAERYKNKIPEKLYNALITYQVEITD
jgi:hypothetical protein